MEGKTQTKGTASAVPQKSISRRALAPEVRFFPEEFRVYKLPGKPGAREESTGHYVLHPASKPQQSRKGW
jgi:hypothetical protein